MNNHRDKRKKPFVERRWLVDDDRSGFQLYSDEVTRDLKGVITHQKDVDPFYSVEADQKLNYVNRPLPCVRKEKVNHVNNDPNNPTGTRFWENWTDVTWENWSINWDDA